MTEGLGQPAIGAPPLTIVLDSNIWLSEHMLRHSSGSAFRFFLRSQNARLAVPEVIRREVEINLAKQLIQTATKMREDHTWMLHILGSLKELVLPTHDDLRASAVMAMEKARIDLVDIPFSTQSAAESLEKCLHGIPPSGPKDQQFKDGVIWSDCLRLAENGPVLLVTQDKGFYEARDYSKGLAVNLRAEAAKAKFEITLSHEIKSALKRLQIDIPVDYDLLGTALMPSIGGTEFSMLEKEGFTLGPRISAYHQLYATDDPGVAHIEFTLIYECLHPNGRTGTLTVNGEGTFVPETRSVASVQSRGSEFVFENEDGQDIRRNVVVCVGSAYLGHRTVQHEIKAPLRSNGGG